MTNMRYGLPVHERKFVEKWKHSWSFFCAGVDGHSSTSRSLRTEIEEEFLNEEKHLQSENKIRAFYLQRKTKSSHHCTELLMYGICSKVEIVEVLKFIVISKIRNTREDKSLKRQWYQIIYHYYFILLYRCEIVFDLFVKNICFEKIVFASNCTALRAKLFPFFRDITTITRTSIDKIVMV